MTVYRVTHVEQWLADHHARFLWSYQPPLEDKEPQRPVVMAYNLFERLILLLDFCADDRWEIFVPDDGKVTEQ